MPISYASTASDCGITIQALKALYQGRVLPTVGIRLGVPAASIQSYLEGKPSPSFSSHLKTTSTRLQDQRFDNHRDRAIEAVIAALKEANRH